MAVRPLTEERLREKVERLRKAFPSQAGRDWFDDDVFYGLARLRGMECRAPYAEAFTIEQGDADMVTPTGMGEGVSGGSCRGCGRGEVIPVVDLGLQPAADYFPPVATPGDRIPRWPLELWFCRDCTLVQLGPVEPQLPRGAARGRVRDEPRARRGPWRRCCANYPEPGRRVRRGVRQPPRRLVAAAPGRGRAAGGRRR